jgi:NADPH:quinone reductase-like Zn-dependent oxidoreductase
MMPLLAEGKLKTVIDRVFPLSEAAEAHRYLESAKQFGKVILRVQP